MELPLLPGAFERLAVPPGRQASVEFEANEGVRLGTVGRRIAVDVAGGLAGLVVDARDVPLRLPERREQRRELLLRWNDTSWPEGT
jgi:hypothetical protein